MKRFPKVLNTQSGLESVLDETRILVAFREAINHEEVQSIARELQLTVETIEKSNKHWLQVNHTNQRYWLKTIKENPISDQEFAEIEKVLGDTIDWIGPVYRNSSSTKVPGYFCPIPNVILIKKSRNSNIEALIKKFGLQLDDNKSKYSVSFYYLQIPDKKKINAFELRSKLANLESEALFEKMPLMKPLAAIPNDTLWASQWNMTQINAPDGWDISTGSNSVVICILDEGCDLTHPDLQFSEDGINLGTMMPTGAPTGSHGTACAGIASATFNNNSGVAGVAGNCLVMPVAFQNWTDVECANGINYATTNGANVISMSFGVYDGWGWSYSTIDPEIENAFNNDVVMAVATGNEDDGTVNRYPGRHPLVIAVGGSSTDDNRKTPISPDGECWGANYGENVYDGITTGVSVVAPCVQCPTTDRQGTDGYNNNGTLSPNPWACVNYPAQPADGNYVLVFDGTSAATPHVAGLAALLKSQYPTLTNIQIRNIIEKSAAKVGTIAYADQTGFSNGTRNQEMGYGRIDIFRALDFADLMIRDWSGDDGTEPSTPPSGNFWDFSDIVVRIFDDDVFVPNDPSQSKHLELGQTNYLYIRVVNNGPREARNVVVSARITPFVGTQFIYPLDWTAVDATHISPTPMTATFPTIAPGGEEIAKFSISSAQVQVLWDESWHPCLVASVNADNDYAFATAPLTGSPIVVRRNNLAQRNLSVINVLASASASFPFLMGHTLNIDRVMELVVNRTALPKGVNLRLALDEGNLYFPQVDLTLDPHDAPKHENQSMEFLEKTRIKTKFGCCRGVLTLAKGSRFDCPQGERIGDVSVKGGEVILLNGQRYVDIRENITVIRMQKEPKQMYAFALYVDMSSSAKIGGNYNVSVAQRNESQQIVGGASAVFVVG